MKRTKRWWGITFSENGEEYTGSLTLMAYHCKRLDEKTLLADGVRLIIDEYWIGEPEDVTAAAEKLAQDRAAEKANKIHAKP